MKRAIAIALTLIFSAPSIGQTVYKCPSATPGAPPMIQQTPCAGGSGESVAVNASKPSGDGGLRPEETAALRSLSDHNRAAEQARADVRAKEIEEDKRQEALNVERRKAAAMEEQAAAMRALRYRY